MSNIAMRKIVIDDAIRARAKEIMTYAFEHRESLTGRREQLATGMPIQDAENYTMRVPIGYNIAYTVEQRDNGWVQHISVFQNTPRIMPPPTVVSEIVTELFGIKPTKTTLPGGRGGGVLAEALAIETQALPNGCLAADLLFPFKFPQETTD